MTDTAMTDTTMTDIVNTEISMASIAVPDPNTEPRCLRLQFTYLGCHHTLIKNVPCRIAKETAKETARETVMSVLCAHHTKVVTGYANGSCGCGGSMFKNMAIRKKGKRA
jgi:hypothetical protein